MTAGGGADRLAELEDERRFLLRSLRDLEREHDAGDVDDADYDTLRDGYTVRAADVLRTIDEDRTAMPPRRPRSWRRTLAGAAIVLVVAVAAGWFVARSSGERLAGDEISGGAPRDGVAALLSDARAVSGSDPLQAQQLYDEVLLRQPEHPEALAYSGWLLVTISIGAGDDVREIAIETARERLDRAVASDPDYPDAHCFLAVIAGREDDDAATARREADRCLALDPPAQVRGLMDAFLASLGDR